MPLVWGTVLLSNVFSRAATPNSFRSRSSKADSARHRGTNYVIKDQQLQEIGWPKEPTCRGAFVLCLPVCTALLSILCNAAAKTVWQKCHGQLFSSGSFTWSDLSQSIPKCYKKNKSEEITAVPISLPQIALPSLSITRSNAGLWHVWVWLVLCPYFAEEPLGKGIPAEGNTSKTSLRFSNKTK